MQCGAWMSQPGATPSPGPWMVSLSPEKKARLHEILPANAACKGAGVYWEKTEDGAVKFSRHAQDVRAPWNADEGS